MKAICKKLLVLLSVALMLTSIGLILTTSKYATAKATTFDVFEMKDGASVKFADNNSGIRFLVKMDKDTKDYIVDNNSVTLKFIITSKTLYDAKTDGQYWNVSKKEVVNVDESKIYQNGDYWYANGCLTQLLAANRKVNLVAIAAIYDGSSYTYASVDTVGAVGSMYDTLNQALLSSSRDYIPSIIDTDAFDWYGTASYPVFINTSANYEKLAAKFAIKSDVLKVLKYNIVDEVNAGTIDNAEFNSNVTTTYRVTFDPNNGAAATSKVYTYGATIAVPSDPAKDGNVFKGWGNPATCTGSATYTAAFAEIPVFTLNYLQNSLVNGVTYFDVPAEEGYIYSVSNNKIVNENGDEISASVSAGRIVPTSALSAGNYSVSIVGTNSEYDDVYSTETIKFRVYNDNSELAPKFNTGSADVDNSSNSYVMSLSDVSGITAFDDIEWFNAYKFEAKRNSTSDQRINFGNTLTASHFKYLAMDIYVDETTAYNWYFALTTGNNLTTLNRYVFNKSTGALVSTTKNGTLDLDTWYTIVYVLDSATDAMTLWHSWSGTNTTGTAYFANVAFYDTDFAAAVPTAQAFSGTYLQNTLVKGANSIALPSTGYAYTVESSNNNASISAGNINFASSLSSGNYSITLSATFDTGVTILNSLYPRNVSKTINYRVYNDNSELAPKFNTPADANSMVTQLSDVSEINAFNGIEWFNAYRFNATAGAADGQRINFMIRNTDNSTLTASNFKYLAMDIYVDDTSVKSGANSNWYFAGATGYNLTTIDRYVFNKSTGALVSTAKNGNLDLDTWYTVVYVLDNATDKMTLWHTWSGSPTGTAYFANVTFYDTDFAAAVPTAQAFSGTYLQNTLVKGATSIALPSTGYAYTVESSNNNASISAGNINFASSLSSGNYSITLSATFDTGVTILNSLYPRNVSKTINYRVYNDNSELAPKFNTPADANSMVTQLSDVSEINAFNGIEWFNAYKFEAKAGAADGQRINFMIRNTDNSTLTASNFKYLAMDIYVDDTSVKSGANSNWYFAGATGYNLTTIDRYVFNKSTGALVSTGKTGILDLDTWYTVVYVLDNATDKMTLWHTWSGSPTGTAYFANVTFYDTDFAAAVPTAQAFSGTYLQNTLVKGATSVALPSTGYTYTIAASDNSASISAGNINFAKALYSGNYSITLNATFDTGVTILNSLCEDSKTIYYRVYNNASELAPKFNTPADANSTVTQLSDVSEISAFDDIEYFNAYKFEAKAGAADGQRINFMIRGTDNSTLTASNFKYLSMDIYVDDTNTGDTSNWYFAGATGYNLTTIDRYVFNKSTGALVSTAKNGTLNLDTWYTVVYVLDNATDKMTLWHTWSGSPTGTAYFANVAFYDKNYCNVGGQTGNGGTLPTIGIGGVENGSLIYDVSGNNSSLQLFRFFSFGTPDNETYDYLEFDFLFDSYQSVTSDNFTDGKMPVVCTGYHSSVSSTPNAVYDMEGNLLYTYATNNTVSGANLQYGTWYHIKVALNSNTSPLYMTMYNGAGNYNIHLQIKNISCS